MKVGLHNTLYHITPEKNRFKIEATGIRPAGGRGIMSRPMDKIFVTTKQGLDRVVKEMLTPNWINSNNPVVFRIRATGLQFITSDFYEYEYILDYPIEPDRIRCVGYLKHK